MVVAMALAGCYAADVVFSIGIYPRPIVVPAKG
jgi:hypothetical protein